MPRLAFGPLKSRSGSSLVHQPDHPLFRSRPVLPSRPNRLSCALLFVALRCCGTLASASDASKAEAEHKALKALSEMGPPVGMVRMSAEEQAWSFEKSTKLHERGLKFWEDYPNDPLRWDVWVLLRSTPRWGREVTENGETKIVLDRERMDAWWRLQQERFEQLLEAPDASPHARMSAFDFLIASHAGRWTARAKTPEGQAVLVKMLGWFERWQREYPESLALINGARRIAEMLDVADPLQAQRFLLGLINRYPADTRRDREIREMAEGRLKLVLGQAYPVWLRLAALDGRFADTRDYAGKLVLVAIVPLPWGEQLDFMHGLQTAYHPHGLEIIHVTGGDPMRHGEAPRTALETAIDADDQKLPWRVAWDRKGTIGEFSRSLGKNVYPAWLLISRDGRFVAETSSQGALMRAIERELALKPQ